MKRPAELAAEFKFRSRDSRKCEAPFYRKSKKEGQTVGVPTCKNSKGLSKE
jgi:hypothetical protein